MEQPINPAPCGSCLHFSNEDVNGNGWCGFFECETTCDSGCKKWEGRQ